MKYWMFLFAVSLTSVCWGQTEEELFEIYPYWRYHENYFKCEFKSRDRDISTYADTAKNDRNYQSVHFDRDSTYTIHLEVLEKYEGRVMPRHYFFSGRYKIENTTEIILEGDHPFDTNRIHIKEQVKKDDVAIRGFSFKLNQKFSWSNRRKLNAFCDGGCWIERIE